MNEFLFQLSFYVAVPFWALMILAPTATITRRVIGSPLIVIPTVVVCLILIVPILDDFTRLVVNPDLAALQQYVTSPAALAGLWAQIIAWDLLVGRWMYLDARIRGVPVWISSPVLFLTVLFSPVIVPIYLLAIRPFYRPASPVETEEHVVASA